MENCRKACCSKAFFSTAPGDKLHGFPQPFHWKAPGKVIHSFSLHIAQPLWKYLGGGYRQELILAVMSRMLFCMVSSPFFSASSTLRMA